MEYMRLEPAEQERRLSLLATMVSYLSDAFSALTLEQARTPGPEGAFAPVEQVWHLADLERDGFGARIRLLLSEHAPHLPDFDGTQIAAERNYRARSLADGLSAFAQAREANLATFRAMAPHSWQRTGTQEGIGKVSVCDMPSFMWQHDAAHKREIEIWKKTVA